MIENQKIRPAQVIGPLGEPLSLADLPPPDTKRWVVRRKAEVVAAVNGGLLTIDPCKACALPASSTIAIFTSVSSNTDSCGEQGHEKGPDFPALFRSPARHAS